MGMSAMRLVKLMGGMHCRRDCGKCCRTGYNWVSSMAQLPVMGSNWTMSSIALGLDAPSRILPLLGLLVLHGMHAESSFTTYTGLCNDCDFTASIVGLFICKETCLGGESSHIYCTWVMWRGHLYG